MQDEASSEATEQEDLGVDTAKHSSKLETAVSGSAVLDGKISTLQLELQTDTMRADVVPNNRNRFLH